MVLFRFKRCIDTCQSIQVGDSLIFNIYSPGEASCAYVDPADANLASDAINEYGGKTMYRIKVIKR